MCAVCVMCMVYVCVCVCGVCDMCVCVNEKAKQNDPYLRVTMLYICGFLLWLFWFAWFQM